MTAIPDSITPVSGWRAWRVQADGIYSVMQAERWPMAEPLKAGCREVRSISPSTNLMYATTSVINGRMHSTSRDPHEAGSDSEAMRDLLRGIEPERIVPIKECSCGIYAAKDLDVARRYMVKAIRATELESVVGRVALWGRVVVHDIGWRGEFAYPQSFYLPSDASEGMRKVLSGYGVPILPTSELVRSCKRNDGLPRIATMVHRRVISLLR